MIGNIQILNSAQNTFQLLRNMGETTLNTIMLRASSLLTLERKTICWKTPFEVFHTVFQRHFPRDTKNGLVLWFGWGRGEGC